EGDPGTAGDGPGSHQPMVKAKEVHSLTPRGQLHDPGLGRFRAQPEFGQQHGQPRQRGHRLPLRPAHHQRIVGVADVGPVCAPPRPVQPVQVGVAHQRTDHPALRGARHRAPHRALFHHSRAQERAQQRQQATVTDAFLDRGHQPGVWNRAEAVGHVGLYHPAGTRERLVHEHLQPVVRRALRAKPERTRQKVGFKDRLEHDLHRSLHDSVTDGGNRQRPPLLGPRLRYEYPPGRDRRNVPARSSASSSSSSRDTPYCSTSARVIWSMPGAPPLRRTWLHARCSTSLRWTLSYSAWNRRSGSALAARYSACCRARTASSRRSTPGAGLAHTALTGHSLSTCAWTKQRPFPSPAVVLSVRLDRYYGRLRRRPGRSPLSRLVTGYRTPRSGAPPQSPGRGRPPLFPPSPSQRSAPSTPGSSSRLNSRFCTASMAFTLKDGARLSLDPAPHGHFFSRRGRLRLMLRTAQLLPLTRALDTALRR